MTKVTFDLYRCEATEWANMLWTEALHFRIAKAQEAKLYYQEKAKEVLNIDDIKYQHWVNKYKDSVGAVEWNRKWLEEIR